VTDYHMDKATKLYGPGAILAPIQWPVAAAWSAIHTVNVPASRPAHTTPGRADRDERDWNLIIRGVTQTIPDHSFSGNTSKNFAVPIRLSNYQNYQATRTPLS
jgi:hypothetical protein